MPIDPNEVISTVERTLGMIPGAVIVVVLLAGPTALWLLYRFVVQPRTSRYAGGDAALMWVCADCRSANAIQLTRCYSCGLDRDEIDHLQVYDGESLVTLPGDGAGWDVPDPSYGAPVVAAAPADHGLAPPVVAPPADAPTTPGVPVMAPIPAATRPRRMVAVGPGKTAPSRAKARTAPAPTVPDTHDASTDAPPVEA